MSKKRKAPKATTEVRSFEQYPFPGNPVMAEFMVETNRLYENWGTGDGSVSGGGWWGPYRQLMAVPAVNRCVKLIANAMAAPLYAFREINGGASPSQRVYPTPGFISDPASGVDTRAVVMTSWAVDFLLGGDAIGIVADRLADGTPTGWFPIPAYMCQVAYVNGSTGTTFTNVYDSVANGIPDQVIYRVGSLVVPPWNVLHVKNLNGPGSLRGAGVLETATAHLRLARDLEKAAGDVSRNAVPTGVLAATSPDVTPVQLSQAKYDWVRKQSIGEVAALAPGVTFTPLSWNPEDRQLMQARQYSDVQTAQLFGVPVGFLGHGTAGLTYSSPTLDSKSFLQWCMNDVYERFEQAISVHMRAGNSVRFDRDYVVIQDPAEQMTWLTAGINAGIILRSEARTMLSLPPIDGIDSLPGGAPSDQQAANAADADTEDATPDSVPVITDEPTEDLPQGDGGPTMGNGTFDQEPQPNASDGVTV